MSHRQAAKDVSPIRSVEHVTSRAKKVVLNSHNGGTSRSFQLYPCTVDTHAHTHTHTHARVIASKKARWPSKVYDKLTLHNAPCIAVTACFFYLRARLATHAASYPAATVA